MSKRKPLRRSDETAATEGMWSLDLLLVLLAGLVLFLVVTRLRFDDPRWLYNGWTYVIAVPLIAILLAVASHSIASLYVRKSIQVGFLFSVIVHLLLLLLAVNVIIFRSYLPLAAAGVVPDTIPLQHTVPEHLFQPDDRRSTTPDWMQPVESDTSISGQTTELESANKPVREDERVDLEIPDRPQESQELESFLAERETQEPTQPETSNTLEAMERPELTLDQEPWQQTEPTAPTANLDEEPDATMVERPINQEQLDTRPDRKITGPPVLLPPRADLRDAPETPPSTAPALPDLAMTRRSADRARPRVGQESSEDWNRRDRRSPLASNLPSLSAPNPAEIPRLPNMTDSVVEPVASDREFTIDSTPKRRRRVTESLPIGVSPPKRLRSGVETSLIPSSSELSSEPIGPRAENPPSSMRPPQPSTAAATSVAVNRRRRELGGPVSPVGTAVRPVESFNRRIMRTRRGALQDPGKSIGPAAEEAIERGLEYLSRVQRSDGRWTLQGHGGDVILRSDTAATGLSLLAFQGAGYTHREHQYAEQVERALQFLISNQKSNGDLFVSEDPVSNQNVALYSHGIAALALCEAYGMTQDPELRQPAQDAIRYIVATQHRQRGGWRYTPQISADTSVTGWMMMALKSGQLAGLEVPDSAYLGIERWLGLAQQSPDRPDRYRYNPFAPNTPAQGHGRVPTPTMTAVGMLMRMYLGWRRESDAMKSAADYLAEYPPQMGTSRSPKRDAYYWYYATMVMFHMGGDHWRDWNRQLKRVLLESQVRAGANSGSWDPRVPVTDRWSPHAGRLYVTTMNLLNLEVYYRHLPIYEDTAN